MATEGQPDRPRPDALLVGDQLALDFLNSRVPSGARTEWLADGAELVDWLEQAGAIDAKAARAVRKGRFRRESLDMIAAEARALREWLRGFVLRHAGSALGAAALAELKPLNRLLFLSDSYAQVEVVAGKVIGKDAPGDAEAGAGASLRLKRLRRWSSPEQLLQPIGEAIADLVCHADFRLIRKCETPTCSLVFLDQTKSHNRRWCRMSVCGNRAKVAAHRARASQSQSQERKG